MLIWLKGLFVVLVVTVFSVGAASGLEKPESQTLLRKEMAVLDSVLKTTVDAVVLNEPARVPPAFDELHVIREQIDRAIKSGVKIPLPKNQKRFREFVRLDNKFHRDLELLLKAANKGSLPAVQRQTHRLLDACVRCHSIFRK
jgi:cytochrome c556